MESNYDMFKWIGLLIILAQVLLCLLQQEFLFGLRNGLKLLTKLNDLQGFSVLLATALRSIGPEQVANCDSDKECAPARVPLMNHMVQPPEYIVAAKNTSNWNVRAHSHPDLHASRFLRIDKLLIYLFFIFQLNK